MKTGDLERFKKDLYRVTEHQNPYTTAVEVDELIALNAADRLKDNSLPELSIVGSYPDRHYLEATPRFWPLQDLVKFDVFIDEGAGPEAPQ